MGNLITQEFLRGNISYKAPHCFKMALDIKCTNAGVNCTFVWVLSKERENTSTWWAEGSGKKWEWIQYYSELNQSIETGSGSGTLSLQLSIFFILLKVCSLCCYINNLPHRTKGTVSAASYLSKKHQGYNLWISKIIVKLDQENPAGLPEPAAVHFWVHCQLSWTGFPFFLFSQ